MKVTVAGTGPGDPRYLLPIVAEAMKQADVVIGYSYYFQFASDFLKPEAEIIAMPLGQEEARAEKAIDKALEGKNVLVIGSGDASIYSMASIVYEMAAKRELDQLELETLPGISAFLAAGSRLGAPLGHDFCCISLSDLMTPWKVIEKRVRAAASADFVTSFYNPKSEKRYWQLAAVKKIFLEDRSPLTPVAIARQVSRPEENIKITTLQDLNPEEVDMFSLVMIGNSQTFTFRNKMVTPRGYLNRKPQSGKEIQEASFQIVAAAIRDLPLSVEEKWAVTRIVHTTGDLSDGHILQSSPETLRQWHDYLMRGGDIVTDVTMVKAGISKMYTEKYGNNVHCFLNDPDAVKLSEETGLTRSQAGMRIALQKYPEALFVVGNAPTALFEITDTFRNNKTIKPAGVIGAPVGFINVIESKEQLMQNHHLPQAIIKGNRGGSNLAAALVNAVFSLDEAINYYGKPDLNK